MLKTQEKRKSNGQTLSIGETDKLFYWMRPISSNKRLPIYLSGRYFSILVSPTLLSLSISFAFALFLSLSLPSLYLSLLILMLILLYSLSSFFPIFWSFAPNDKSLMTTGDQEKKKKKRKKTRFLGRDRVFFLFFLLSCFFFYKFPPQYILPLPLSAKLTDF